MSKTALIVVDMQNDFLPGYEIRKPTGYETFEPGALAVPGATELLKPITDLVTSFAFDLVVATQDWHPEGHGSFASSHEGKEVGDVIDLNGLDQHLWPDHCVQGTVGAEFAGVLEAGMFDAVFQKGTNPEVDSYSGFYDNDHRHSTGLAEYLRSEGVDWVFICGLATDYCVKFTVLDAIKSGFKTGVILDLCRGVNVKGSDTAKSALAMSQAGATVIPSKLFPSR